MSGLSEGEREALAGSLADLVLASKFGTHDGMDVAGHFRRIEGEIAAREAAWRGEVDGLRARVEELAGLAAVAWRQWECGTNCGCTDCWLSGELRRLALEPASDATTSPSAASEASGEQR